jgi:radical SAM-linked protein
VRVKEIGTIKLQTEDIMDIRFQFKRGDELKFIGHLDVLRLFERAFKRSGLQVTHSQGFNPRPQIVFGQPMPLGLTSDGEFADVKLDEYVDVHKFINILNEALPPGIEIVNAKEKRKQVKLTVLIAGARYRIEFDSQQPVNIHNIVGEVLNSNIIRVVKKTKSREKEVNIRPLIYELAGGKNQVSAYFDVLLRAGQADNVRPELFLAGVCSVSGLDLQMRSMHRFMLYGQKDGRWLSLLDNEML